MAKAKKTPSPKAAKAPRTPKGRVLEKKYLKSRPACKVTFTLPRAAAPDAATVCLMGEFNDWSPDAVPLKVDKAGDFAVTIELARGRAYRFRYVIDGVRYENHWCADRYEPNVFGGEDSIVEV
jgi:1,4-alpha-glucan branching enzyme